MKYVNDITRLCIIRASREEYQKVWSAVTMVRSIAGCPVLFNLLDLSGELKNCNRVTCMLMMPFIFLQHSFGLHSFQNKYIKAEVILFFFLGDLDVTRCHL